MWADDVHRCEPWESCTYDWHFGDFLDAVGLQYQSRIKRKNEFIFSKKWSLPNCTSGNLQGRKTWTSIWGCLKNYLRETRSRNGGEIFPVYRLLAEIFHLRNAQKIIFETASYQSCIRWDTMWMLPDTAKRKLMSFCKVYGMRHGRIIHGGGIRIWISIWI